MNINIIAVGKIKEKFIKEACAEYAKRMSRFCKLNIVELADEPMSDRPSESEKQVILQKEGARILNAIKNTDVLISLCVEGRQMPSERFAGYLQEECVKGANTFTFVIGGSVGLLEEIKQKSKLRLSFSEMTFPHQLMRVVLLEQIYRAFKINANESYHK
ncbi:MAG: 23S rRNA (pseudouridine(1915)-N(3))-methyltransferase RlmH [Clostridia bacterium]|nr:23S rRNA (pseudouridine(1915)-N(3))-methyltransferase RlmH [Clostridia bacterium]